MAKFRKTALIEATQWHKMGDHPAVVLKSDLHRYADEGIPWIETLEGGHVVTPGDWIATGVQGEHWPIKPDVFAATYEPANTPSDQPAEGQGDAEREGAVQHLCPHCSAQVMLMGAQYLDQIEEALVAAGAPASRATSIFDKIKSLTTPPAPVEGVERHELCRLLEIELPKMPVDMSTGLASGPDVEKLADRILALRTSSPSPDSTDRDGAEQIAENANCFPAPS